jgi:hypothetical protein
MINNTLKNKEFIARYADIMGCEEEVAKCFLAGFIETVLEAMKNR